MGDDTRKIVSGGYRVRLGDKTGTVRRVMSDGRSRVEWDDETSTVEDSGRLIVMPEK